MSLYNSLNSVDTATDFSLFDNLTPKKDKNFKDHFVISPNNFFIP